MAVSRATIDIPRIGVWHADLLVDSFQSFKGAAVIQFVSQTLNGTFARNGPDINKHLRARIVGGAGSLGTLLKPKGYRSVPLRIPLDDALNSCGEKRSTTCDQSLLNRFLDVWSRLQMSGGQTIDALLQQFPTPSLPSWRMLLDGTLWVGIEYWPVATFSQEATPVPLYSEPERGNITFYSNDPTVLPGQTLVYHVPGIGDVTKRISHVRHWLTPRRMHTSIYSED